MYFRVSIQVLFISKTFQYFHMSIPQASCALETCFPLRSLTIYYIKPSLPFILVCTVYVVLYLAAYAVCWSLKNQCFKLLTYYFALHIFVGCGCIAVVSCSVSVLFLTINY